MKLWTCLSFLVILYLSLFVYTAQFIHAESLEIKAHPNPGKVSVGSTVEVSISVFNNGKESIQINDVKLKSPADWKSVLKPTIEAIRSMILVPNRTEMISMNVTVPDGALGGNYKIDLTVSTVNGDYNVVTDLEAKRIESIPLSGDLPLSIFVIIFAGALTYTIVVIGLTRKFERSYFEVGLVSVGLGIFNWYILYSVRVIGTIDRVYTGVRNIQDLLLFSLVLGGLILGVALVLKWVIKSIQASTAKSRFARDLRRRGYSEGGDLASFVKDQADKVIQNLGKKYSMTVRVTVENILDQIVTVDGILFTLKDNPPYDLILYAKYVVTASVNDVILALTQKDGDPLAPFTFILKEDKEYRKNIVRWIKRENLPFKLPWWLKFIVFLPFLKKPTRYYEEINNAIESRLTNGGQFLSDIARIDFSKYSRLVTDKLIGNGHARYVEYSDCDRLYIPGDKIRRLEVIKYESAFAVNLLDLNTVIPKVYRKNELAYVKDVTLD